MARGQTNIAHHISAEYRDGALASSSVGMLSKEIARDKYDSRRQEEAAILLTVSFKTSRRKLCSMVLLSLVAIFIPL